MWLPVSTVAALCVLLDAADATAIDKDLEVIFRDRSEADWQKAWHREKYIRCRDSLKAHVDWACRKDIYRLKRRSQPYYNVNKRDYQTFEYPWIHEEEAYGMIRSRRGKSRRSGSSITAECCSSTGCTWEEYAEYCPKNNRKFI